MKPLNDNRHPGRSDPWFTLGSWWCFLDRDRALMGWVYHQTRPNLGFSSGGVWVWDDSASLFAEARYYRNFNHQPVPANPDLSYITWSDGVTQRSDLAAGVHTLSYRDPGVLDLDLRYTDLFEPYLLTAGEPPHLVREDQATQVSGKIVLDGESISIDCLGFRDRSWGIRSELVSSPGPVSEPEKLSRRPIVYLWGTVSAEDAFFVIANRGYLVRNGHRARLVKIEQQVDRDDETGLPCRIRLTGRDAEDRRLEAEGEVLSRIVRPSGSSSFACISLVEWSFAGTRCAGDAQDVWPAMEWSAYRRWSRESAYVGKGRTCS